MRRTLLASGAVVAALVFALLLGWWQVDGPGADQVQADDPRPLPLTEMSFTLTDQSGRNVGPDTLTGKPALVFFGFTHCPEICPTTLSDISGWLDELGTDAERITPVLITVDPERDTVEILSEYVAFFHPAIQGWTGTPRETSKAAAGFEVRYRKVPLEEDYTMDHTAGVFLFDATGRFVTAIDYHEPRDFALPKIRRAFQNEEAGQ